MISLGGVVYTYLSQRGFRSKKGAFPIAVSKYSDIYVHTYGL